MNLERLFLYDKRQFRTNRILIVQRIFLKAIPKWNEKRNKLSFAFKVERNSLNKWKKERNSEFYKRIFGSKKLFRRDWHDFWISSSCCSAFSSILAPTHDPIGVKDRWIRSNPYPVWMIIRKEELTNSIAMTFTDLTANKLRLESGYPIYFHFLIGTLEREFHWLRMSGIGRPLNFSK